MCVYVWILLIIYLISFGNLYSTTKWLGHITFYMLISGNCFQKMDTMPFFLIHLRKIFKHYLRYFDSYCILCPWFAPEIKSIKRKTIHLLIIIESICFSQAFKKRSTSGWDIFREKKYEKKNMFWSLYRNNFNSEL